MSTSTRHVDKGFGLRVWHGEDGGGGSTAVVKPKRTLGASENQTHAVGARTTAVGGGGEMETMVSGKTEKLPGMSFYIKLLKSPSRENVI
ncbi:hypothetical protein Tco_0846270 [Tanacetum coccineum]